MCREEASDPLSSVSQAFQLDPPSVGAARPSEEQLDTEDQLVQQYLREHEEAVLLQLKNLAQFCLAHESGHVFSGYGTAGRLSLVRRDLSPAVLKLFLRDLEEGRAGSFVP